MTPNNVVLSGENSAEQEQLLDRKLFEHEINEKRLSMRLPITTPIELTEYQKEFASDKLKYMHVMHDIVEEGHRPSTHSTYLKVIETVEKLHPETMCNKHPAWKTLCKYWKRFVNSDFEAEALACKKRDCRTRLNTATENFLSVFIGKAFSNSNSNVVKNYYRSYTRQAKKAAVENENIKIVSQRTFRRRLKQLNEVSLKLNNPNLSEKERNKLSLSLCSSIKTQYALQRVEVDRVCLNLCLIDDNTHFPTPSISLYLAIDAYTRAIVSVVVDFGAENKLGVLNSLRNIFISNENLPYSGRPESIVLDNGPGYNNTLIKKLAESLSINLVHCPSNHPEKKPFIESFNRNLRNNCLKGTEITTASGEFTIGLNSYLGKRTDHKALLQKRPKDVANLLVSDFKRLLNTYMVHYHNTVHPSTGKTPNELWHESMIETPRDHFNYESIKHAFHVELFRASSKLQSNGTVYCQKQIFESEELRALYGTLKDFGRHQSPIVKIYFDKYDARQVTVVATHPVDNTKIEIIARNVNVFKNEDPISFDDLNGHLSVTANIDINDIIDPKTPNALNIEKFCPVSKRRSPKRGPSIPSYEANNMLDLNTEERITKSQKITKMKDVDVLANIPPPEPESELEPTSLPEDNSQLVSEDLLEDNVNDTGLNVFEDDDDEGEDVW
ncbi:hypothetical protein L2735_02690 [Shewanella olleyana]|uniref:hypothetical protein n=1 Tax=Shewanella olleyana TaxID=135626 RepID=UPI00200D7701|nr:hypothetical protein [Shewanella olleyana]MCL1065715.1 hypothetical protein [Shewanella olleyana]